RSFQDARTMMLVPPPIQGLGLSGGFQMQVELTDGSFDFARLQTAADAIVADAVRDPAIRLALTPLRASVPQVTIKAEKTQASNFGLDVGDVYSTVQTYLGSSFVNQFTLFGRQYMVYAQADAPFRRRTDSVDGYYIRTSGGQMVPLGTVARIERAQGPSLITLYNLYPSATINGAANEGFSSAQPIHVLPAIARP